MSTDENWSCIQYYLHSTLHSSIWCRFSEKILVGWCPKLRNRKPLVANPTWQFQHTKLRHPYIHPNEGPKCPKLETSTPKWPKNRDFQLNIYLILCIQTVVAYCNAGSAAKSNLTSAHDRSVIYFSVVLLCLWFLGTQSRNSTAFSFVVLSLWGEIIWWQHGYQCDDRSCPQEEHPASLLWTAY